MGALLEALGHCGGPCPAPLQECWCCAGLVSSSCLQLCALAAAAVKLMSGMWGWRGCGKVEKCIWSPLEVLGTGCRHGEVSQGLGSPAQGVPNPPAACRQCLEVLSRGKELRGRPWGGHGGEATIGLLCCREAKAGCSKANRRRLPQLVPAGAPIPIETGDVGWGAVAKGWGARSWSCWHQGVPACRWHFVTTGLREVPRCVPDVSQHGHVSGAPRHGPFSQTGAGHQDAGITPRHHLSRGSGHH